MPDFTGLRKRAAGGFSLIEIAVILLFVSVAMVPIVNSIGGPGGQYGSGSATKSGSGVRVSGSKHKEILLANALMERALAGQISVFNTPLDPATGSCSQGTIPAVNSGETRVFNCYNGQYGYQNQDRIYYQWIVTDRTREFRGNQNTNQNTMGNDFYKVTLNMYTNDTWTGTPILTMPANVFRNTQNPEEPTNKTGIVIVLDVSGSMDWGGISRSSVNGGNINVGLNLPYRYRDAGYNPDPDIRIDDLFNNITLDIVAAKATDDLATAFNDTYPRNGVLDIENCGLRTDDVFGNEGTPPGQARGSATAAASWYNVCNRFDKTDYDYGQTDFLDENISRLEAARSSLLQFLITIEDDPALRDNISLGFITYTSSGSGNTIARVPNNLTSLLESADGSGHYVEMRKRLSWLNRTGSSTLSIMPGSGTPTWEGVFDGARMLYSQPQLNSRAIFLVTDGIPTSSYCNGPDDPTPAQARAQGACMRDNSFNTSIGRVNGLGRSLGNGTFPGSGGQEVTIYSLGLMAAEDDLRDIIEAGFTTPTSGDFQYTNSVGEMAAVFENIKYSILKEIIQANALRYGINY